MYAQLEADWRKIGPHLYQRRGRAFIHVAVVPPNYKGLWPAVRWYLEE